MKPRLPVSWIAPLGGLWLAVAGWAVGGDAGMSAARPRSIERDYLVQVWKKEHGLPDDRINCLLVDRWGFLWAGTRRGVARFDGNRFVIFSRSTTDWFVSENCTALAEEEAGRIWVGTRAGLIELGASPRRFGRDAQGAVVPADAAKQNLDVCALDVAPDGRLMMGTREGLLLRGREGIWARQKQAPTMVSSGYIPAVLADLEGALWAGGISYLLELPAAETEWRPAFKTLPNCDVPFVFALAETPQGVRYAVIGDWRHITGRLYRLGPAGWRQVSEDLIRNNSNPPWLAADRQGGVWYPMNNRILVCWAEGRPRYYRLDFLPNDEVVFCLREDLEGNLWLGTASSGLVCLSPRRIETLTTEDGLPNDNTWTLIEASDGALWVGTDGGVARLTGRGAETWTPLTGLAANSVRALAEDAAGRVWIGTGAGLNIWDQGSLISLRFPGEWFRTKIRVLQAARDGTMWVGAAQGLHRVRGQEVRTWLPKDGLPHENVLAILEDRQGDLWLGTGGGGLARMTDAGFEVFNEENGLTSQSVWVIHEDEDGFLWLGTDRGLNCLREGKIQAVTTAQGLPDNLINSLVEDRHGWFWIGHDNGVYRVRRAALLAVLDGRQARVECVRYDREDGLLNPETNGQKSQPPALLLRDGRVAFATVAGVAIFDPDHPPELTNGPPARIERLRAAGRPVFSAAPGTEAPGPEGPTAAWARVEPGEGRQVEIAYTAPSFRSAEHTRFRYRLQGLDDTWRDVGRRRSAVYASLPPGDYVFEVRAGNQYGYWSALPARIAFRVIPHFYERLSVQVAGGLLILLAGYAVVRWRWRELRRLARLEEEAARSRERLRLARDLHDGLGANLTELTLLSGVGDPTAAPPEDLAERFRRLSESTHDALHSLRDLIWTTSPKADTLEGLISRLRRHTERLGAAAKVAVRYDLPLDLPEIILGPEARRDLLRAADEALNNAVRHAGAREIWLRVGTEPGGWFIEVTDNGRGFDVAGALKTEASAAGADSGLGLASMHERVEGLGGYCEIQSTPGRGTRVRFHLPLTGWEARG